MCWISVGVGVGIGSGGIAGAIINVRRDRQRLRQRQREDGRRRGAERLLLHVGDVSIAAVLAEHSGAVGGGRKFCGECGFRC